MLFPLAAEHGTPLTVEEDASLPDDSWKGSHRTVKTNLSSLLTMPGEGELTLLRHRMLRRGVAAVARLLLSVNPASWCGPWQTVVFPGTC